MRPFKSQLEFEVAIAQRICEAIDTPVSLGVSLRLKYGCWHDVATMQIDPGKYTDARHFADDYLVSELLRKSLVLPMTNDDGTPYDRQVPALLAWRESELRCAETNRRLLTADAQDAHPKWFRRYRHIVQTLCGELTSSDVARIPDLCKHGPGATLGVSWAEVPSSKYNSPVTCTRELAPFAEALMGPTWWAYASANGTEPLAIVPSIDQLRYVPKNALTARTMSVQPTLLTWYQLGCGMLLRERLRSNGACDLRDQGWNQLLASYAEERGLATVDLKSASDSIAWSLPLLTLDHKWFHLLDIGRVNYTQVEASVPPVELSKFCAMGNGYTFPLETVLFLAAARTVVPRSEWRDVTVYGDDIIVPQAYAPALIDVLDYLGFETNTKKTHLAGAFFESCGQDFFQGVPVRPFYLRQDPLASGKDITPYAVKVANRIRLWAAQRFTPETGLWCDPRLQPVWNWLYRMCPTWGRCLVPVEYTGAGFIVSDLDAETLPPARKWRKKWQQYEGKAFRYMVGLAEPGLMADTESFGVLLGALTGNAATPYNPMGEEGDDPYSPAAFEEHLNLWEEGKALTRGLEELKTSPRRIVPRWACRSDWPVGLRW